MAADWKEAEQKVANILRNSGANCEECTNVNSKLPGNTDVIARWNTGRAWRVQVKYTNKKGADPEWPPNENIRNLKSTATKNGQTAVVAWVYANNTVDFFSAEDRRKLTP